MKTPLFIAVLLLAGCNLVPTETAHQQQLDAESSLGAKTTADVITSARNKPSPIQITATASGKDSKIEIATSQPTGQEDTSASTTANDKHGISTSSTTSFIQSIPEGVKLILFAIGILLILWAAKAVWAAIKTTGVGQGIALANDKLAERIHTLRTQAATEPDAQVRADLVAGAGDLEKIKGDLAAKAPAKKPP